ncbi:MAG: hypothetical protein PHV42_02325 [Candidatus Pacebacteria bacterium]|nr:hypothetical protein [Candidatus Paceibacterota bacterium]
MKTIIFLLLAFVILAGTFGYYALTQTPPLPLPTFSSSPSPTTSPVSSGGVVCSLIAKLCPDGSYVARVPPTCEFAKCPGASPTPLPSGTLFISVTLGPTCPVERIPPDPNCAPKPYQTKIDIFTATNQFVRQIETGMNGSASFSLPVGVYELRPVHVNVYPRCENGEAAIQANVTTSVALSCDTGIR